jgi:hypothetical protein
MSACGISTRCPFRSPSSVHGADDTLGAVLRRRQIDLQPAARQTLGRRRADDAQLDALQRAQILRAREQPVHERVGGVAAGKHDPIELRHPRARGVERAVVVGRNDPDHRRFDRLGAHLLEALDELDRLFARPRHEHALAEQRTRIEPAQMIAQRDNASDDENGGPPVFGLLRDVDELVDRAGDRFLRRQRAVVDDRRRILTRPAVRQQRREDDRQLLRPGVAHDRAVEPREAVPVHRGACLALVFVSRTNVSVSPPPGYVIGIPA